MRNWRSALFVPADEKGRLEKAGTRGADALILDLEDAVPQSRKPLARAHLFEAVPTLSAQGLDLVVRINSGWYDAFADIQAAMRHGVTAIMVPKVENAARLEAISGMIAEAAAAAGLQRPPDIIALVESPAGIANLPTIASASGVIGVALGSEDFSLALGVPPSPTSLELPCRMMALAAAQFGVMALGLPVSIATIEDSEAWARGIDSARGMGISGALCIHPRQIEPANLGFAPSATDIDAARRLLEAWEAANGVGVIAFEGRMVDLPLVLAAKRTIERAGKAN